QDAQPDRTHVRHYAVRRANGAKHPGAAEHDEFLIAFICLRKNRPTAKTHRRNRQMLKPIASWRNVFFAITGSTLIFAAGNVFAEWWGTNAPPCSNGHCAPVTPWGYTPPQWHRWPGVPYPDMIKPASATAPGGEEGTTPSIEIPPPNKEAEMQTAPPLR